MKLKSLLVFALFLFEILTISANDTLQSKIVFYREHEYVGSALGYKIFINDTVVTRLLDGSYFEYNCKAGNYTIKLGNREDSKMTLSVEQGKTYYLMFDQHSQLFTFSVKLILVDSSSALPVLQSNKLLQLGDIKKEYPHSRNRIGVCLGIGNGFSSVEIYKLNNGATSSINFGGMGVLGLYAGREFTKYFDLSGSYFFMFNEMNPRVQNIETSLKQHILSITPAYIIPISGGYKSRLKLGFGLDYNLGANFQIKDTKTYNLNYESQLGWHLSTILELNMGKHFGGYIGLKCGSMHHSLESSNVLVKKSLQDVSVINLFFVDGLCFTF